MKISMLLPSRQRPERLMMMYESAMDLADNPELLEMVVYTDDDDHTYDELIDSPPKNTVFLVGPRKTISQCWNDAWRASSGEIYWHGGDDNLFKTQGWDSVVRQRFEQFPDRIVFVYGADGNGESERNRFGTHGFIHKNWTDTVGYFVPPYYESDYNDTHLNDLGKSIGRHEYIDILIEHMHYSLGKSEIDQNTKDRLARHKQQRPDSIYNSRQQRMERSNDAEKLRIFIEEYAK